MLSPDAPVTVAKTETVERPAPGLARGRWEAPAWAFDAVALAAAVVLAGALARLAMALRTRLRARRRGHALAPRAGRVRGRS